MRGGFYPVTRARIARSKADGWESSPQERLFPYPFLWHASCEWSPIVQRGDFR